MLSRLFFSLNLLCCFTAANAFSLQHLRSSAGHSYTVATVNLSNDKLRLHWESPTTGMPYLTFAQLRERLRRDGKQVQFMTNSGIYAPGFKPLGLHIEEKTTVISLNKAKGGGNFALLPNGVFWVDGQHAGIAETREYEAARLRPQYATQSGPLLVQNGQLHPAFNKESQSRKYRSGVGICRDGKIRFILSQVPVNFYTFATYFRSELRCPNALYLDGSISAYAGDEKWGWKDTQFAPFAGIWSVSPRKE